MNAVTFLLALATGALALVTYFDTRRMGRIARLHVVLQFELSSGAWDDALADLEALERLPGGSWREFSAMVRATIQAGLEHRVQPVCDPMAGKRWDEDSQSYVPVTMEDFVAARNVFHDPLYSQVNQALDPAQKGDDRA